MDIRQQIKAQAIMIGKIENLEEAVKGSFLESIDRYGSTPNPDEFRIIGDLHCGSGIKGSIEDRMYIAQKEGLKLLDERLKDEARKIISEFWGKPQAQEE